MPLSSEEALQIVTLILVVCMCALGAACIVYVFLFRSKIIHGNGRGINLRHLRDFNSPWLLRILLSILAVSWVLLEIFRMPIIRRKGWMFHGVQFQGQANLCRSYVLLSLGVAEPAFFLTALFLIRDSLCDDPFSFTKRRWRFRALALISILSLPVFLVQLFFVVITPAFEFSKGYDAQKEGYGGAIPKSFTQAFVVEDRSNMTSSAMAREVAVCRIPLLSTVAMSVFSICYVVYFLYLGWKMMLLVINKRLQIRVYGLVLAVAVLVPLHLLLLGLSSSALSTKHKPIHEVVAFLRFMTIVACAGVGEWVLVIRPISDAMMVLRVSLIGSGSMKAGRLNSWGAIPLDQLSLPLSAALSVDEDRTPETSVELTSKTTELTTG